MGRWEPDARGRLAKAALDLYDRNGYEQTTVAEIAAQAGVTERTFFRHYADKREVLFDGSQDLQARMVAAVLAAPAGLAPLDAVAYALDAAAELMRSRHAFARRRRRVIHSHPELRSREVMKLTVLSDALAAALRDREVAEPAASLAAAAAIDVFHVGFEQWVGAAEENDFGALLRDLLGQLRTLAAG